MSRPRRLSRLRRCVPTVMLLLLIALPATRSVAQEFSEDQVKAAFLYRFTGYVEWPSQAMDRSTFTIAVQCGNRVADDLQSIVRGKQIKGHPVQVQRLRSLRELDGDQMLYIGPGCYGNLQQELQSLASRPVLVVTDESSGIQDSGTINFLNIDHHVRFEVSLSAARLSHLTISSELLSVAVRVLGELRSRSWCDSWYFERFSMSCPRLLAGR